MKDIGSDEELSGDENDPDLLVKIRYFYIIQFNN